MTTNTKRTPNQGSYLIARPYLRDPNFWRSVVFLVEHNQEGSLGFVLNRPIEYRFNDLLPDFPEFDAPVFLGGPVGTDALNYIHRVPNLSSDDVEIMPGVFWGGNFEDLKLAILAGTITPDEIKVFVGYSGWEYEQLEKELRTRSWFVSPANPQLTFHPEPVTLWQQVLSNMGERFRIIGHYPTDPSLN